MPSHQGGPPDQQLIRVAFRQQNDVGARDEGTFAAQWLAYALLCQRFEEALAGKQAFPPAQPDLFLADEIERLRIAPPDMKEAAN